MTAKQYLGQISRLNKMIANKLSEIYQIKSMALNISVLNEEDKVQTSGSKDRIGDMVAKMAVLCRRLYGFKKKNHYANRLNAKRNALQSFIFQIHRR